MKKDKENYLVRGSTLSFSFGSHQVLSRVNINVRSREVVGLLGPNGSGKSTLLKLIARLAKPSTGFIEYGADSRIGYIFQNVDQNLIPWKTSLENVLLPTAGKDPGSEAEHRRRALELFDKLDLGGIARRYSSELSIGQKQLVSILRWIVQPPDLLLIDEAWSMLDVVQRQRIHDIIRHTNESGTTVVIISHNVSELSSLCNTVYLLSNSPGTIVDEVTLHESMSRGANHERLWERAKRIFPSA